MRRIAVAALAALSACAVGLTAPGPAEISHVAHGLSAIEVTDGGTGFIALSDRGQLIEGRLHRVDGRLRSATITARHALQKRSGKAPARVRERDSEGLALGPDGTVFVSYEGNHRIAQHTASGAFIAATPIPPGTEAEGNRGVEALARGDDGTLYALPEWLTGPVPLWAHAPGGAWIEVTRLPSRAGYAPAGADIGPDGRLYILERAFLGVGFAARVLRVETDGSDLRTVLDLPLGRHGNLEGLSIWRDGAGRLRATMVEDDNFQSFQRGGIVEYVLE